MKIFLPDIKNANPESVEDMLFRIIRDSSYQQRDRSKMRRVPLLDQAARAKAIDMRTKVYFAHTSPEGVAANENVRAAGYPLPDWYPLKGNNVESLYLGFTDPNKAAEAWYKSDLHRLHVYATAEFFKNQNCIGIGIDKVLKEDRYYYVFLSAPEVLG